ncbi:MAG TPA: hypothetical protein VHO29_01890 [Marmoricola sp.]|nr:hypothetical protein [Marmoricola sp.]
MVRLLLALFGPRWGILPPLAVFVLSPLLVESTLWWSAGINQLPALAGIVWALDAHVRHLRSGRTRSLLASLAWVVFGLAFAEFTLLLYLFLVFVTLAYFAHGSFIERVRHVWDQHRRAALAHGAVLGAYAAVYLHSARTPFPGGQSHPLLTYLYNMGAKTFATTAVGGPLSWNKVWPAGIEVAPSDPVLILSWAALGALVVAARRSRARSMRSVLLVLLLLSVKVLLLSTERAVFGPQFALDVRFAYDVTLAFALALGLAFIPVLGSGEGAEQVQRNPLVDDGRVVIAATLVMAVLATISTARFPVRNLSEEESPRSYVEHVRSSLTSIGGPVQMAPGAAPAYVTAATEVRYQTLLPLVSDRFVFPKVAVDEVYVTDARGHLERVRLKPVRRNAEPADHGTTCPFEAANGRVAVPLDGPVMGYGWTLQISYTSSEAVNGTISIGGVHTKTRLPAGQHVVTLPGDAQYDSVRISGIELGTRFCVQHVVLGTIQLDY